MLDRLSPSPHVDLPLTPLAPQPYRYQHGAPGPSGHKPISNFDIISTLESVESAEVSQRELRSGPSSCSTNMVDRLGPGTAHPAQLDLKIEPAAAQ